MLFEQRKNINRGYRKLRVWADAIEYYAAGQLTKDKFDFIDILAYKLENGLLKLIESIENKQYDGVWNDTLMIRESNEHYGLTHPSNHPSIQSRKKQN